MIQQTQKSRELFYMFSHFTEPAFLTYQKVECEMVLKIGVRIP